MLISMPAKTLAVASQKGGVDKTTLTFHLACGLAKEGLQILAVDRATRRAQLVTLYDALANGKELPTVQTLGFDLVPGSIQGAIRCPFHQPHGLQRTDIGMDILVIAPENLCQGPEASPHRANSQAPKKRSK